MRDRDPEVLERRKAEMERLFRRESFLQRVIEATFGRRRADKIVIYEALKRKKGKNALFTNLEIKRILYDWDIKPVEHSPQTSYDELRTRKGLAAYVGNANNAAYSEQLLDNEQELTYREFYGVLESSKSSVLEKARPFLRRAGEKIAAEYGAYKDAIMKPQTAH